MKYVERINSDGNCGTVQVGPIPNSTYGFGAGGKGGAGAPYYSGQCRASNGAGGGGGGGVIFSQSVPVIPNNTVSVTVGSGGNGGAGGPGQPSNPGFCTAGGGAGSPGNAGMVLVEW